MEKVNNPTRNEKASARNSGKGNDKNGQDIEEIEARR